MHNHRRLLHKHHWKTPTQAHRCTNTHALCIDTQNTRTYDTTHQHIHLHRCTDTDRQTHTHLDTSTGTYARHRDKHAQCEHTQTLTDIYRHTHTGFITQTTSWKKIVYFHMEKKRLISTWKMKKPGGSWLKLLGFCILRKKGLFPQKSTRMGLRLPFDSPMAKNIFLILDLENFFQTSSKWRSTKKRKIFQKKIRFSGSYASDRKTDSKNEFFRQFCHRHFFSGAARFC
jgi:hypothetical protein